MSKPYAKIVVSPAWGDEWAAELSTDMGRTVALELDILRRASAIRRAHAWSRRLGNIPVEVKE